MQTFYITTESFSDQSQFRLIARRYFSTESQIRLTLDPKAITNKTFFLGGGEGGSFNFFFGGGGMRSLRNLDCITVTDSFLVDLTEC